MRSIIFIPVKRSKRLENKNLQKIGGISLLGHTINACKQVKLVEEIWCSSNDKKLLDEAKKYDVHTVVRSNDLAKDDTSSLEVLQDFADEVNSDFYCLVQAPFYPHIPSHIDDCIALAESAKYEMVISTAKVNLDDRKFVWIKENSTLQPWFTKWMTGQDFLEKAVIETGAVYVFSKRFLKDLATDEPTDAYWVGSCSYEGNFVDIDVKEDLDKAREIYQITKVKGME